MSRGYFSRRLTRWCIGEYEEIKNKTATIRLFIGEDVLLSRDGEQLFMLEAALVAERNGKSRWQECTDISPLYAEVEQGTWKGNLYGIVSWLDDGDLEKEETETVCVVVDSTCFL